MRPSSHFLFFFVLFAVLSACAVAMISAFACGEGAEDGISARVEKNYYESGETVKLTAEYHDAGYVSVQVKNQDNETILIETVEIIEGVAVIEFALDERAEEGSYGIFISGVTMDGSSIEPENLHFKVQEEEDDGFILFGLDGYMVIAGVLGVIIVVSIVATKARNARRRKSIRQDSFSSDENAEDPISSLAQEFHQERTEGAFVPQESIQQPAPQFIPEAPIKPLPQAEDEFSPPESAFMKQASGSDWQCPNCGSLVEGMYRFCANCGTIREE